MRKRSKLAAILDEAQGDTYTERLIRRAYRAGRADVRRLEEALELIVAIAEEFDGAVEYAGEIAREALGR